MKNNQNDSENNEENIIDEIIRSLGNNINLEEDYAEEDFLTTDEEKLKKSEYEIVMNCDDSDYIIYYKKRI